MGIANLNGPYELTVDSIEKHLGHVISAGVVVLGLYSIMGTWEVKKVDRSDVHLLARLWANVADFPYFCYQLCADADEAYLLHCELYHLHHPLIGQHPTRPEQSRAQCPVCSAPASRHANSVA